MRDAGGGLRWFAIAAIVIVADQISKAWVEAVFPLGASMYVLPVFDLVHVRNSGAAFSFLAGASGWQRELFITIGIVASAWISWMMVRAGRGQGLFCLALSLILGGALGNVIDRVRLGSVVDFLSFHWGPHHFPAFNLADTAISCGAMLLVADAFMQGRQQRTGASAAAE